MKGPIVCSIEAKENIMIDVIRLSEEITRYPAERKARNEHTFPLMVRPLKRWTD